MCISGQGVVAFLDRSCRVITTCIDSEIKAMKTVDILLDSRELLCLELMPR